MADRLAQRVAESRRPTADPPTAREDASALVPAAQADSVSTMLAKVRKMEPAFAQAAPRAEEAARLIRDAVTAIRRDPKLAGCQSDSVLGGLMTFAQLGLRVGVLGHGWLLPIYDKGVMKAQVVIGYKGYVSLGYDATDIRGISARTIHSQDYYRIEYGTDHDGIVHRPPEDGAADRGDPVGYYAVVKHGREGRTWQYMSHPEMLAWRDLHAMSKLRHKSGRDKGQVILRPDGGPLIAGPWVTNFEAMAWKSVFLRCVPWIPMSERLEYAVAADEGIRVDYSNPTDRDGMLNTERPSDDDEGAPPEPVRGRVVIDQRDSDDAAERQAAHPEPEDTAEPEPERPAGSKPALPATVRDIVALLGEGKVTDPAAIADVTAWMAGLAAPTPPNELNRVQAAALLERLRQLKRSGELVATLTEAATAGTQPADGGDADGGKGK